jgi:hypothetical protein
VGSALLCKRESEGGDGPSWAWPWWGREAGRSGQTGERRERGEILFFFSNPFSKQFELILDFDQTTQPK